MVFNIAAGQLATMLYAAADVAEQVRQPGPNAYPVATKQAAEITAATAVLMGRLVNLQVVFGKEYARQLDDAIADQWRAAVGQLKQVAEALRTFRPQ